jgi:type IV pilus assembly protein PilB
LLESYRRRLGDVAVEHGLLAPAELQGALLAGRGATAPLGELLVASGLIDAVTLRTLLADLHQSWHLPILEQFWEPAAGRWLPEETARACRAVPLLAHGPWLVVVAEAPLSPQVRAAVEQASGAAVLEVLGAAEAVEAGLAAVYAAPAAGAGARPRLGNLLLERGLVTLPQLLDGLQAQARTGLPLGRALVDLGYLSEQALQGALQAQASAA